MQDEQFVNWLNEHKIEDYELLEVNERKGRYCISFEINGCKRFLKWNMADSDVHKEFWQLLRKEESIYSLLQGKNISPPYKNIDGVFSVDFIQDAKTLRKRVKELVKHDSNTEELFQLIRDVLFKWQCFIQTLTPLRMEGLKVISPIDEYRKYLGILLLSGPFETKKLRGLEITVNRFLYRFFLKKDMEKSPNMQQFLNNRQYPVTHGDFHANNVIIGNSDCFIIDYENVQHGSPEIEQAYMYAQICLLIRKNKKLRKRLDNYINNEMLIINNKALFWSIFTVYSKAIRFNRRFY